ncbi:ejaculatory bulb-specific protein 3-like [Wyeomyia smithii]|uniref:ejaculatory bulb-specific protein 3-like n=1 Tax=Wyeomyia smithii TaxID=174621 RepID=UPI0024682287|nr:ejaculatory bulb-specific protein 3-like [Wyeomyia smithii]XP_055542298.1 ejaculatory bulb-specific protein 3-like [Wyeomyia smithii]XP_055542299.1 ejaculatory bulb-specific protein 3-like [Wyeomyia smithii]XP_055542300.1 ejaculatory bulb-specific protein 3-like [Wyeomyia smithii]XP_055542301.1 ejaculatory bulb-specific protein 3-like [Wyeomyia smithii]XP_055542302.1 ejaculatory bulb-specific protein 3-like [Wyeomyia smithii]
MKLFVAIFALLAIAAAQETPASTYTSKYDNIDVDEILKSDRLFKNYFQCLTDEGRCTPEGNELKRILPEALETNCAKCSEGQRTGAIKAFSYLNENRPEEWKVLRMKYDPENKYIEQYRDEAEKNGIKL